MKVPLLDVISIHAPTRGATQGTKASSTPASDISIHAPTRGATISSAMPESVALFQSTLPREERPNGTILTAMPYDFNPRSHERSDSTQCDESTMAFNFNPRSHERSDKCWQAHGAMAMSISIHAPTRGATSRELKKQQERAKFQSTLPREERQQYCTKNLFIFIQYRQ